VFDYIEGGGDLSDGRLPPISLARRDLMARRFSSLFKSSRLLLARLAGAGAGFLSQLILARLLPAEDLGMFFAATSFAALAGLVLTQGYPGVMQRFITRYRERQHERLLASFVWQVQAETILLTIAVALAVVVVGLLWPGLSLDRKVVFLSTALCTAAASSLTVYGAFASVERRFELAQLPETLIRPLIFLPLILVMFNAGLGATAGAVTALYAGLTATLAYIQYARIAPAVPAAETAARTRSAPRWRAEARLFALAVMFATSFADLAILLSSPFLGSAGLAPFGVALKTSLLIGFSVQVAHQVALPDLAEAHERGDASEIWRSVWQATAFPSIVTGMALLAAALGGERFLALFGSEYASAKWPLLILLAAQFLRAVAGPGQSLLMLKGAQVTNAAICVVCTITLALSNAALVPSWGIYGASFAVLITVGLWCGASAYILAIRHGMRVDLPFLVLRAARI
jgi:O-antigen/teichoic acid export membrane protein